MAQIATVEMHIEQGSFDPKVTLGSRWQILGGDKRNLNLKTIDLSQIVLDSTIRRNETSVNGQDRHTRLLASGSILLGADVFWEFWKDPYLIPREWEEPVDGNPSIITFDGGYVYGPAKSLVKFHRSPARFVLYLIALGPGCNWGRGVRSIEERFFKHYRAATLPWNYKT